MIRYKKYLVFLLVSLLVFSIGCRPNDMKDENLYYKDEDNTDVEQEKDNGKDDIILKTDGINPFVNIDREDSYVSFFNKISDLYLKGNKISYIATSKDGNTLFAMESMVSDLNDFQRWQLSSTNELFVMKGEPSQKVNLLKIDLDKNDITTIAKYIDFVSLVKWSKAEDKVGFLSGNQILVYDLINDKMMFEDYKNNSNYTYFGWSSDESKIYTEDTNLINGSIYYLNSEKVVRAYETDEDFYYKGRLDNQYYIGTKRETDERKLKYEPEFPEYRTIITDKEGKMIKKLMGGRYRGIYKRSLIQIGESEFGLYYYKDMEKIENQKILTEEYVYDAKFIKDGNIAYIIKDKDNIEENNFILNVVDDNGNQLKSLKVSGAKISLTPDGKYGTIKGAKMERVDFDTGEIVDYLEINKEFESDEEKTVMEIMKTIRGAMNAYLKFKINKEADYKTLEKYFINSRQNELAALDDMKYMFSNYKDRDSRSLKHVISLYLKGYEIYEENKAFVKISGGARNSFGSGLGMDHALELIKKNDRWYVAGFSTFSNTKEAESVRKKVLNYIRDINEGRLFDGKLKGMDIKILQIQFWRMSEPHLSPEIDSANYCKVYLLASMDGEEKVYKLVLNNKDFKGWKPTILEDEGLGHLF